MKGGLTAVVALVMIAAACHSSDAVAPTPSGRPFRSASSNASPARATEPILATWRREQTCEELVRAFAAAGVSRFGPKYIRLMNYRNDPVRVISQYQNLCSGTRPVERTAILRENGYFTNYEEARIVDDCHCYQLVGDHTFVLLGGDGYPDISLHYAIHGDTVRFKVQTPHPCSTNTCQDQVAFAIVQYGLGPWKRID